MLTIITYSVYVSVFIFAIYKEVLVFQTKHLLYIIVAEQIRILPNVINVVNTPLTQVFAVSALFVVSQILNSELPNYVKLNNKRND